MFASKSQQPETREKYAGFLVKGWTGATRHVHADERIYTFWVNEAAFRRNAGFSMDILLLSPELVPRLRACGVDAEHPDTRSRVSTRPCGSGSTAESSRRVAGSGRSGVSNDAVVENVPGVLFVKDLPADAALFHSMTLPPEKGGLGLEIEGVIAKRRASLYWPGARRDDCARSSAQGGRRGVSGGRESVLTSVISLNPPTNMRV